ncbi:MAG: SDR family oxidoreductase [Vicinamibacterales bacterium]
MKVLILGGRGMLGHKVWQIGRDGFECRATIRGAGVPAAQREAFPPDETIPGVDAADFATVERAVAQAAPDVIVNCIGIVKQLDAAADPVVSIGINALFPHRLARLAAGHGARLIHVSTDCVYTGRAGRYTEDDPSDADDLYGRSKRLGEPTGAGALTIRTSIVGRELHGAHGLVEWFLANRGGRVRGFTHAWFSGLTTEALARTLVRVIDRHRDLDGLFHVAADRINKRDLITLVNDAFDAGVTIEPDATLEIDRSLDAGRFRAATGWAPDPWPEMVRRLAADPTPYDSWRQG